MNIYRIPLIFIFIFPSIENLQNDFTITSEYASLTYTDKEYVSINFNFFKLNRTIGAASATFATKFIVDKDVKARVRLLQFRSNEYRNTIADLGISVCSVLNNDVMDAMDLSSILKHSNVTKCPMLPGVYYIERIVPQADGLPPLIPPGRYKVVVDFTVHDDVIIATIEWLAKVNYKLKME